MECKIQTDIVSICEIKPYIVMIIHGVMTQPKTC